MAEELAKIRPIDWRKDLKIRVRRFFSTLDPRDTTYFPDEQQEKLDLLSKDILHDIEEATAEFKDFQTGLDALPAFVPYLMAAGGGMMLSMLLSSVASPATSKLTYASNRYFKPYRLSPETVYRLWFKLYKGEGLPDELISHLRDIGLSPETIEQGKEASKIMPTPQDVINFLAHEVFEPEMIKKYSLESEWERIDTDLAERIGLDKDTLKLYWLNHWQHPSLGSVYGMLHRDLITESDMKEYYRLVETPEYWRDKLTELSWDTPNRIETRMMARYLDLPKSEVVRMLQYAGLKEEFRSDAADFMLVMGLQGYWSTMYRNGWLTAEGLLKEIETKDLSPTIAERVYKYIVKAEAPQRIEETRKLTRALIIKGLKEELLSPDETIDLLITQQNYDRPEAEYIVAVEIAAAGSPKTPLEFKQLVNQQLRAEGKEVKEIPLELIEAERYVYDLKAKLKEAQATGISATELNQLQADIALAQAKFEDIKATLP